MKNILSMVSLAFLLVSATASAHHSAAAYAGGPLQVTGTVTKWQWTNPHAFLWIDYEDADGNMVNGGFELGSPNTLIRNGFKKDTFLPGETATIYGSLRKDGQPGGAIESVYVHKLCKWLQWGPAADAADANAAAAGIRNDQSECE